MHVNFIDVKASIEGFQKKEDEDIHKISSQIHVLFCRYDNLLYFTVMI